MSFHIFDCGCVVHRPKLRTCNNYGTRWRAYITDSKIILKCRDCGKNREFVFKDVRGPIINESMEIKDNGKEKI